MQDHTLRSKIFLASGIERSEIGMLYCAPALLRSTFSVPPVSLLTEETQAVMDSSDKTSSGRVSIPREVRKAIFEGVRAVAKTRWPDEW